MSGRVRKARRRLDLSAREIDRRAHISPGHTQLIESGKRPRIECTTAVKLADALGVTLDWLLRGEPGPAPTNPCNEENWAPRRRAKKPRRTRAKKKTSPSVANARCTSEQPVEVPTKKTGTDDE